MNMQNVYQLGTDKGERTTQLTVLMNASFDNNYLKKLVFIFNTTKEHMGLFAWCFVSLNFVTRTFLLLPNPTRNVTAET